MVSVASPWIDDIHWVFSKVNGADMVSFLTDPFLSIDSMGLSAKLIYSSEVPYGEHSISCSLGDKNSMYRVAYRLGEMDISHVSDTEIQDVAFACGLERSSGINSNLSFNRFENIYSIKPSIEFLKRFVCEKSVQDAEDISLKYGVGVDEIRLTGGAQINTKGLEEQHDIDVVIPINSKEHAHQIWEGIKSRDANTRISERGFISPMRWYSTSGSMICPFFVYGLSMAIPIKAMKIVGRFSGIVQIKDASLSLVSMPLLRVSGQIEFVAFRSRIVRAALNEGDKMLISSALVEVTDGAWAGQKGALILEPFAEIENLKDLLSRWNA